MADEKGISYEEMEIQIKNASDGEVLFEGNLS